MLDLTTTYLGLKLKHPLVASASPLSKKLDTVHQLANAGASAIVMYSLFEEQIIQDGLKLHRDLERSGLEIAKDAADKEKNAAENEANLLDKRLKLEEAQRALIAGPKK